MGLFSNVTKREKWKKILINFLKNGLLSYISAITKIAQSYVHAKCRQMVDNLPFFAFSTDAKSHRCLLINLLLDYYWIYDY